MNDDFAPFELAVKLKEKGFRELCLAYYTNDDTLYYNYSHKAGASYTDCYLSHSLMPKYSVSGKFVDAPTISQVLKWLRDTSKLFISPCVITDYQDDFHRDTTYWSFIIVNVESGDYIYREYERVTEKRYDSYEQAALAGVNYVLDNLI